MQERYNYEWFWIKRLPQRKGSRCAVLVRSHKMNSILVKFQSDGFKVVTSKWAVRRARSNKTSNNTRSQTDIKAFTEVNVQIWVYNELN